MLPTPFSYVVAIYPIVSWKIMVFMASHPNHNLWAERFLKLEKNKFVCIRITSQMSKCVKMNYTMLV